MSTPSTPLTNEQRAKRWGIAAKVAAVGVFGFFVAPFILQSIAGLLGVAVFAGLSIALWSVLPVIGDMAANTRLKLMKAEAARNPVETLQNEHKRQSLMLEDRKNGIETMSGAIRTLAETIHQLEREFPDSSELPQMKQDHAELLTLEQSRRQGWQEAYISLGEFAKEIKRVSRIWDVAQAAAKARQQSGLTETEWAAKLKTDTSSHSIRTQLNTQLAALSVEKMQSDADRILKGRTAPKNVTPDTLPAALPAPSRTVIDVAVLQPAKALQS